MTGKLNPLIDYLETYILFKTFGVNVIENIRKKNPSEFFWIHSESKKIQNESQSTAPNY